LDNDCQGCVASLGVAWRQLPHEQPQNATVLSDDQQKVLVHPQTWQGHWADFITAFFPTLGSDGQSTLMHVLMLLTPPNIRDTFFRFMFEQLLDQRASVIKAQGKDNHMKRAQTSLGTPLKEFLPPQAHQQHQDLFERDVRSCWNQAAFDQGVDMALFELVGKRMSAAANLLHLSNHFVQDVTGRLKSHTDSAFCNENGFLRDKNGSNSGSGQQIRQYGRTTVKKMAKRRERTMADSIQVHASVVTTPTRPEENQETLQKSPATMITAMSQAKRF
jgi:hypothetical protein